MSSGACRSKQAQTHERRLRRKSFEGKGRLFRDRVVTPTDECEEDLDYPVRARTVGPRASTRHRFYAREVRAAVRISAITGFPVKRKCLSRIGSYSLAVRVHEP